VAFLHPFILKGVDRTLPPGEYQAITDEEMIEGLSFPVYRAMLTRTDLVCIRSSMSPAEAKSSF
jgi:hypothetical protein